MGILSSVRLRRSLGLFCALSLVVGVILPPAARAEDPAGAQPAQAQQLTLAQAQQMEQADAALAQLTNSPDFEALDPEQRQTAAADTLDQLADQQLIQADSIYYDPDYGMYTFSYACGVLGGLMLEEPADDSETFAAPLTPEGLDALSGVNTQLANAIIYYAFDDPSTSTRYPYYVSMERFWDEVGLDTTLDSEVTVRDLRSMDDYDLCILSAHGAYYTYRYRVAFFWQRTNTAPVIMLTEESTLWKDLLYAFDLLTHRVIKINGSYCLLPSFFSSQYAGGQLDGTIVFSETCEFLGVEPRVDVSMADAMLQAGADAVIGYVNTVYTIYSRNLVWDTVNQLIMGRTVHEALSHAINTYGANDVQWYLSQGGLFPHSLAAYPMLGGNPYATLYALNYYEAPAA